MDATNSGAKQQMSTFNVGASFVLTLASGITGPFVFCKVATATVTQATDKAIKVRLEGERYGRMAVAGEVWLPRKAIVGGERPSLAKWFRPDARQFAVMARLDDGVISL